MKKLSYTLLAGLMALSLSACGSDSASSDTKVIESTASSEDSSDTSESSSKTGYSLTYQDMTISVDADAAPIVEALGEPSSYFESPSCAAEGTGKLYTYSDIEIQTYPDGDKDLILYVMLRTDSVSTDEGIDLSSSKDDVIAAYGQPSSENDGSLTYDKGDMSLNFLFDGDSMISIEYDSALN